MNLLSAVTGSTNMLGLKQLFALFVSLENSYT